MSRFPSVAELRATVTRLSCVDSELTDAERIDLLRGLEELKNAAAGAQAVLTVDFDRSRRAAAAARGVPAARRGLGVVEQVALARRESPFRAGQLAGAARVCVEQMPHTLAALRSGVVSEYRASILAGESGCLSREHRAQVDVELAGPAAVEQLAGMGNGRLRAAVRRVAYRLDAEAFVARARKAEQDRRVSLRPAPEAMVYLAALLPLAAGVGAYAALTRAADTARCTPGGQPRSRGQLMADLLVDRLTGPGTAGTGSATTATTATTGDSTGADIGPAVPVDGPPGDGLPGARAVTVQLVMTDRALLGGDAEPALVPGYGPVAAEVAREVVRRAHVVWLRRLLTDPVTGSLTAADPAVRRFPRRLADLLIGRAGVCRTPWCDAPVRHADHVVRWADGGPTSVGNAQGLCERCSQATEAAGWAARATGPPDSPDEIVITTPPATATAPARPHGPAGEARSTKEGARAAGSSARWASA